MASQVNIHPNSDWLQSALPNLLEEGLVAYAEKASGLLPVPICLKENVLNDLALCFERGAGTYLTEWKDAGALLELVQERV